MLGIQFASALLRHPSRRRPARYVPVLHGLEERCLLSTFNEYPVPDNGHGVYLSGITAGPDGNVWFTNAGSNFRDGEGEIESITPAGAITTFPQPHTLLGAIVTGADGNLWYGGNFPESFERAVIGQITPDGTVTKFFLPSLGGQEFGHIVDPVTLGPDGNVWYGQAEYTPNGEAIGHIAPDGQATSFLVPPDRFGGGAPGVPASITAGPDGNVWFIPDFIDGHYFAGRVTPDGQFTFFETPGTNNVLGSITAGPDGNLWAPALRFDPRTGQRLSASIDQITVNGQFTEFPLPDASHAASSITLGPDGNFWFTEPAVNQIGMMTPDGQLTEYAIPTPNSNPQLITAGPDGNIWFTEVGSGQIGEFVLNDGGGAGGAARSVPPAKGPLAVNVAAVEALFAGTGRPVVDGVANSQPSTVARVDPAFPARPAEAVNVLTGPQLPVEAGNLSHLHQGDRAVTHDLAGLTDPLTDTL
jgi:virginiamycin B lyase